jgi:hypothetical protein
MVAQIKGDAQSHFHTKLSSIRFFDIAQLIRAYNVK